MNNLRKLLFACIFAQVSCLTLFAQNIPVIIQAESGVSGSDFTTSEQEGVTYITSITDVAAPQNPGSFNKVVTYSVTFATAGTYDLYAKVRVGPGAGNDDSFYYSNGFGPKSATIDADWITANQLAGVGWSGINDVIAGPGTAGGGVWKWIRLSQYDGGEPPITFTVPAHALTQTFQIGSRENGLDLDQFAFARAGLYFTVSQLNNGEPGSVSLPPPPPSPTPTPPIGLQAESGTLGSEFTTLAQNELQYITTTTTGGGGNPGSAERVASYTVTFPQAGRYDLYVKVRIGAEGGNDDSFFYSNGFGIKSPVTDADWIVANNLASVGWTGPDDVINGPGAAGTSVWKWIKLSSYDGGEPPITFNVPAGGLTQTFQIGRREDGLDIDQFAFTQTGLFFTVSNLDNGEPGSTFPPGPNVPIAFQTEYGTMGSDFTILNAADVYYITPTGTTGGQNPGSTNRVATFSVTFPRAGVYDLYARVRVSAGAATDDSFYYGNGFGTKSPANDADWITANNLWNVGWSGINDIITAPGTAQTGVWKWIKLSQYNGGEAPVTFTVPEGSLTQIFQIGGREDGLDIDRFAFTPVGLFYTPGNLLNQEAGSPTGPPTGAPIAQGQPKFLGSAYSNAQAPYFQNYWNQVTPENGGKWGSIESTRDVMNWVDMDAAYNFAKTNGFPIRFHILVWGNQQPAWIETLPVNEQLEEINEWFAAVSQRYPDLDYVEVVNEPLHDSPNAPGNGGGNYIQALGGSGATGWDWVLNSFRLARQHFPGKKLMINEFSITNNTADANRYIEIINLLKAENLIDMVGIQGHAFSTTVSAATTLNNLNLIADQTGLPIQITELDIDGPTDQVQLDNYKRIFPVFWEHPSVIGVTLWGWKPGHWRTAQGAYIAQTNGAERPALVWLRQYVANKKPVIVPGQAFIVNESVNGGDAVGVVQVTDPDAGTIFQNWEITGGSGAALFVVSSSTGELTVANNSSFDFETTSHYTLLVRAGDGLTLSAPDTITINVTNANDEAPIIASLTLNVNEDAPNSTILGVLTATDGDDTGSELTTFKNWTITSGNDSNKFSIDSSTGVIITQNNTSLDFETDFNYVLTATVSDGVNTSEPASIIINIRNVNDNSPVVTDAQSFNVGEDASNGTVLGTVSATDADDTNEPGYTTLQDWRIVGGSGAWFLVIDPATGALSVRNNWLLDFERTTGYTLIITVSDGTHRSAGRTVTVNIINANDNVPVVKSFQRFFVNEWVSDNDVIGKVLVTDRDDRNDPGFTIFQNWQITGGSGSGLFRINNITGEITVERSALINRNGGVAYSLRLRTSDGVNISSVEQVTIYVSNKVNVCHHGRTIQVQRGAVAFHLRHGDSANACGASVAGETFAVEEEALDTTEDKYQIFPNPIMPPTQELTVALGTNELNVNKIEVVEFATNRVVTQVSLSRETAVKIPCTHLRRGVYLIRFNGDRNFSRMIIVD